MLRLSRRGLLILTPLLILVGGLAAYWLKPVNPDRSLAEARSALRQGDRAAAERILGLLEQHRDPAEPGQLRFPHHVQLLRGEITLAEARELQRRATALRAWTDALEYLPFLAAGVRGGALTNAVGAAVELAVPSLPAMIPSHHALAGEWSRTAGRARDAFRAALVQFDQVRGGDALPIDAALGAGECLVHLRNLRRAAAAFQFVVERRPDQKDAHRWLASIYMDLNAPYDVTRHLQALGRLDLQDGRPYRWLGFFYKDFRQLDRAVEAYQEALGRELTPEVRSEVVKELADVLVHSRAQYDAGLELLAQCPGAFAQTAEMLALRAECLWGLGRPGAVELVEEALRLDADSAEALLLRARIWLTQDHPEAARPLLEKAVQLDPHEYRGRNHLVETYRRLGDPARAAEHQRQMEETKGLKDAMTKLHGQILSQPWNAELRFQIASLWLQLERPREARMWLQATLACDPRHAQAQDTLRLLGRPANAPLRGVRDVPAP